MTTPGPEAKPKPKPRRRWFRFQLRTLLIAMTVFAVWLGWNMHQRRQHQKVIAEIRAMGGTAQVVLSSFSFLNRVLSPTKLENNVWLQNKEITDDDLRIVRSLRNLVGLHLADNRVSDKGLAHLADLTKLEYLDLTGNPQITDEGLAHLQNLTELKWLLLRNNSQITDEGLVHLENLQKLDLLILYGTSVTPAGRNKLQAKLPKTKVRSK